MPHILVGNLANTTATPYHSLVRFLPKKSALGRPVGKLITRIIKALLLMSLVGVASVIGWRIATGNEGVVLPGELYRSAQLATAQLTAIIQAHGIKTVINLRGENARSGWYQDEIAVCRKLGVEHVDIHWSAQHLPPPEEVAKLLVAYRDMPRPILLHCRSGADRTGLASSIYLIDQKHVFWKTARRTLSWQYGHLAIYPYFAMDEFVQLYGQSGRASLAEWVARDYPATYASESKKTEWDEITEPLQLAIRGSL